MSAESDRLPLVIAAYVPVLVVSVSAGVLRFLGKRRRGVRAFRRALRAGGMPPAQAAVLAERYHAIGSLSNLIRAVRWRGDF